MSTNVKSRKTKTVKQRKTRKPRQSPNRVRLGRLGQVIPTSDPKRTERLRKEALSVIDQNLARIEGRKPKAPVQHSEQGKLNGKLGCVRTPFRRTIPASRDTYLDAMIEWHALRELGESI